LSLLRGLWEVAYANNELHHHEELLIRRLADLMYVPHADFIRSKLRVLEALGKH
ncbi:MAG: TerB family tellurite resistance protein, partial [Gammaproteobacteria bacterium]|nr:TerB family tellurite resistance protein [Gammaproteobacteria bacterium]